MSLKTEIDKLPIDEKRKIAKILRDKEGCAPDASNSWMYEQPQQKAEDFLLGKTIKRLEELTEVNRDKEEETPSQRLTRFDMEAKFREDPLNLMRQHEYDKRSALLQNTVRMKKLQRLIEQQALQNEMREKEKKIKKRKKEKEKKHIDARNHKRRALSELSSGNSSGNSEDDAILDRFISLIQSTKTPKDVKADGKKEKNDKKHKKDKKNRRHHRHYHSREKQKSLSSSESIVEEKPDRMSPEKPHPRSLRSRSPDQESQPILCDRSSSRSLTQRHSRQDPKSGKKRSRSPQRPSRRPPHQDRGQTSRLPAPPRRRTREEMAALREQMAADAKDREVERRERYETHRAEKKRQEREELESKLTQGAAFLKGVSLDHVARTSVEEGIQRNANKRQRGGMEENFLRR